MVKDVELSERGWKQGIGSVANAVRVLQPAIDNEISVRCANETKFKAKMEQSIDSIERHVAGARGRTGVIGTIQLHVA